MEKLISSPVSLGGLDPAIPNSCLGIDIGIMKVAPFGKLDRIDYYFEGKEPLALAILKPLFRSDKPILVSRGQLLGIFKRSKK